MKNGKKPTRQERMKIKSYNLNPENWLIFKKVDGSVTFDSSKHLCYACNSKLIV